MCCLSGERPPPKYADSKSIYANIRGRRSVENDFIEYCRGRRTVEKENDYVEKENDTD